MTENRSSQRFVLRRPVASTIAGTPIVVLDISCSGLHVEHAQPLGRGFRGRVVIRIGAASGAFPGEVAWSRPRRTASDDVFYESGIRVVGGDLQGLIAALRVAGELKD